MFALVMVAAFGSSIPVLILTTALIYMPGAFRICALARRQCERAGLRRRSRGPAARARLYLIRAEILPNMIDPVLADFGLRFVFVVLLLSGLSFLGLGVQPPDADLGLAGAREYRRPPRRRTGRGHAGASPSRR